MAIGYICPCCGERVTRDEEKEKDASTLTSTSTLSFPFSMVCQPCNNTNESSASLSLPDMSVHTIPLETPVVVLEAQKAFDLLTSKEQYYAYHLGKADWEGAKINLLQCSIESVPIFALLQLVFGTIITKMKMKNQQASTATTTNLKEFIMELVKNNNNETTTTNSLTETEVSHILIYAASFYGNIGNYKSFGDTKFVPAIAPERFEYFLQCICNQINIAAGDDNNDNNDISSKIMDLWTNECCERMYSLPPRQRQMGLGKTKGISTYFSANCNEEDAKLANAFLDSIGLSAYNTRLFKHENNNNNNDSPATTNTYMVRLASACTDEYTDGPTQHEYQGNTFYIQRGDYAPIMKRVVQSIQNAIPYVANNIQEQMLQQYIISFDTGSHNAHKDASRFWIQDKGPAVESYIGFIESYRDPSSVRGEWEGFVACVNKDVSAKFQTLVDHAETFLSKMPWPKEFEKDTFLRPDFTSLEILSFGSSGVPAGINIPNYDDIRQSEGFKNVSLGNVLQASYSVAPDQKVSFIAPDDQDLYKRLKGHAFEVQVGIHELLGHGSGKLYHQGTNDVEQLLSNKTLHPITKEPITGPFYGPGATWGSTFGKLAPTYEECRAECSGLFLCLESDILNVFGVDTNENDSSSSSIHDVSYINWLLMARAGLTGLEFYTPATEGWRQAHMQARYVILRLLLEANTTNENDNETLLSLNTITGDDGKPDVQVVLNRNLISSLGRKVIGEFLLKLQIYKSLGDYENGSKLYNYYSHVPDDMIALRDIVMARKEPRKLLIQPHMYETTTNATTTPDNEATTIGLLTFPSTVEGMIESFVTRFPLEDPELLELYHVDKQAMTD